MKHCSHKDCTEINPQLKINFHNHKKTLDGLGSNCKSCQRRLNKLSTKKYKLKYPFKNAASRMKRYAAQKHRTPKWLTPTDIKNIELVYKEAERLSKELGIKFHVDHVIPLQGQFISGLHVLSNLQILLASDNVRKSNRFEAANG